MATSVRLIRRYVWLIDTIRRAGHMTYEEINREWMEERVLRLEHEEEFPERTFHRHRQAIADLFGIDILCNRYDGNRYYIDNDDVLNRPSFTSWLFNGLSIDNLLTGNEDIAGRIMYEDAPGGTEFAAAASVPICPMIAVYDVNPIPQHREPPMSGRHCFMKSDLSCFGSLTNLSNAGRI